jgi:hypothetical protein
LPKREAGYSVYARALGKPTDGLFEVTPGLNYVEDGNGNVLLHLGTVLPGAGFVLPNGTFFRISGKGTKGGGKSTAIEITQMFEFNGTICYFDLSDVPVLDPALEVTETELCCDEVELLDENGNTVYDEYGDPVMVYQNCVEKVVDICPDAQVTAYCADYDTNPLWIFNVAEFVEYFWDVDSNGVHLLQVRFYPN